MRTVLRSSATKNGKSSFLLVLLETSKSLLFSILLLFSFFTTSFKKILKTVKEAFVIVYKAYFTKEFPPVPDEPVILPPAVPEVVEEIVEPFIPATPRVHFSVSWPDIHFPHLRIPHRKKRRGRPRRRAYQVFLMRLGRFLGKILPTPLRVGVAAVVIIVSFFVYSLFLVNVAHDLPTPDRLNQNNGPITTEFYDRNGQLLYRLYENKNRTLVSYNQLPPNLVNATVAIEDKNYWAHSGIDLVGIARALVSDSKGGNTLQGGSTITQQLVKNMLLTPDRTWQRKVKEVFLSFWAERIFNKQQILEMYFNEIGYGGTSVGIEAAAQTFFGKSAHNLDLAQSAYLAGLPASPTDYSPYGQHPELGQERQKQVLERMVEDHYINPDQMNQALTEKLAFQPPTTNIYAPHFVMYVKSLLAQKYGDGAVSQGGLKVYTSLDLSTQQMAEQVVSEEVTKLAPLKVTNGAAIIEDPRNGQILAMVGSKDYWDPEDGNFNVALAARQPGSSIKPITYATAFKQGFSPGNTILDGPTTFVNPWGMSYSPVNYDGRYHGVVTMRTALGSSYNIPAVKTLAMVGIPNMLKTAHDMGITTLNDTDQYGLSLTLGAGEVRLIDMMSVYSTFSQMGIRHTPNPILKVTDSRGDVLEDNTNIPGTRVLSTGISYLITSILSDNNARTPAFGPNSLLNIPGHTIAVKTGTTDDKRDNWTFGYTPKLAIGVWVGNNDNTPMDPQLTSGVTGAAPIWNRLMTNQLNGQPDIAFSKPDDVKNGMVNGHQDLVLTNVPQKNIASSPTPGILTLDQQAAIHP
jgi:1A family penicillin-binding protein